MPACIPPAAPLTQDGTDTGVAAPKTGGGRLRTRKECTAEAMVTMGAIVNGNGGGAGAPSVAPAAGPDGAVGAEAADDAGLAT